VTPEERQVEREVLIALERLVTRMENFFAWRQAAQKYRADQLRWPAGSPDSVGGRFAPENGGTAHGNYLRTGRRPVQLAFAGDDAQLAQLLQANQSFGPRPAADTSCKDQGYDDYYPQIGFPRLEGPPCHRQAVTELVASWSDFKTVVDQLADAAPQARFGYMEFFSAEGGTRPDINKYGRIVAVGGIFEQTLRHAKASGKIPGLENVTDLRQITDEQRAQIYQWALDDRLHWAADGRINGHRRIGEISSPYTAAAVVDMLLRNSRGDGAELIQNAINDVLRVVPESERRAHNLETLDVDRKLGAGTFQSLLTLEALGYGPHFREALANRRTTAKAVDAPRNDHFRFRGKP
jgi:hypothetical protein